MQKPKFIQYMINKNNEQKLNRPKYKIEDLRIGNIIYLLKLEYYNGPTLLTSGTKYTFKNIKPFAIFYQNPYASEYIHIGTHQPLDLDIHCGQPGKYVIQYDSIKEFKDVMLRYMIKNNLKKSSKLSINEIKEIEKLCNEYLYPNQKQHDIFG